MAEKSRRSRATLEWIANLATVVASVAVCFAVARQTIWSAKTPVPLSEKPPYVAGERLTEISNVNFAAAPQTVVLYLRSTCHFCELSMPFYKALSSSPLRKKGAFRFIVASSESAAVTNEYLKQNQVSVDQVVSVPFRSTKIRGTPTLLLVDRNAAVVKTWMGLLRKTAEEDVLTQLSSKTL